MGTVVGCQPTVGGWLRALNPAEWSKLVLWTLKWLSVSGTCWTRLKSEAGSGRIGSFAVVLGITQSLTGQTGRTGRLPGTERGLGKELFNLHSASIPNHSGSRFGGFKWQNDRSEIYFATPKKIVRLPGCFRIFEALVWNKWLSKSLPHQPSRPERMTTCILGGPRPRAVPLLFTEQWLSSICIRTKDISFKLGGCGWVVLHFSIILFRKQRDFFHSYWLPPSGMVF